MKEKKRLFLFVVSFILPLIFFRLYVFVNNGRVSLLRELTGLQIHHSHYGIILTTIAVILILFYEVSVFSVIFAGLGLGTMFDSFISSLFPSFTRAEEISHYFLNTIPTTFLFLGVISIVMVLYFRKCMY